MMAPDQVPPGMLLPARQKRVIMAAIMLAMFAMAVNQTIISVSLPRIIADLGGLDLFAWPLTSYLLASTAPVPVFGKLSDIYGRKPFILIGLIIFMIGTALAGTSGTMIELIAYRAVQGLGGGLIMATAFTAIGDLYPPSERGRWSGLFSGVFALASIVGPLVGGTITDQLSWRWIFYVNLPIGIIAFVAVFLLLPWFRTNRKQRVDYRGGLFLMAAAVALLLGLSTGGNQFGWTSLPVLSAFAVTAAMLLGFLVTEKRMGMAGVLPLALFRQRAYVVSISALAVVGLGMFGVMQFMPLFVQGAQGLSATSSGLVTMPMMGGLVVGSIMAGQGVSRFGHARGLAVTGGLVSALGAFLLSTLEADSSQNLTRLYMILLGYGIGVAMPLYSLVIQNSLPLSLLGVGSSSAQFFRQIGGTMGLAVFGSVMVSSYVSNIGADIAKPGVAALAESPQLLLDPDRIAAFTTQLDAAIPGAAVAAIATARVALSSAVTDLFFVGSIIMLSAVALAAFLPTMKLRSAKEMMAEMGEMRRAASAGATGAGAPGGEATPAPDAVPRAAPALGTQVSERPVGNTPASGAPDPVPVPVGMSAAAIPGTAPPLAPSAGHARTNGLPTGRRRSAPERAINGDAGIFARAAGFGAAFGLVGVLAPRLWLAVSNADGVALRRSVRRSVGESMRDPVLKPLLKPMQESVRDARRRTARRLAPLQPPAKRSIRQRFVDQASPDRVSSRIVGGLADWIDPATRRRWP